MSVRTEKVSSLIRHELGTIISRDFSGGSYGFTTVTEVRMTLDLKIAKIYVSIFGDQSVREKTLKHLEINKVHIRTILASHISLKFTPALQFYHDATLDNAQHIEALIKKIHKDDATESK